MVDLNVNIAINGVMAESSAETHVYVGQVHICTLFAENKMFTGSIPVNGGEVSVSLKSTYAKDKCPTATENPLKKAIAYLVLFIVNMFSVPEPLECPYEYEENMRLTINGAHPMLSVKLSKPSASEQPQTIIRSEDICMERTSKCFINQPALRDFFSERKRALNVFATVPVIILLFLGLLSALMTQYVTSVFLLLIIVLVFSAFFYSKHNLKKQYLKCLKKVDIQKTK